MFDYLVDVQSRKVLLLVQGPIRVQPGQKIVQAGSEIPVRLARYDEKTDSIIRLTDSTGKRHRREGRALKDARSEAVWAEAAEFKELFDHQSDSLQRMVRLMIKLPPNVLLKIVGEKEG
jgi:hypothetical protein